MKKDEDHLPGRISIAISDTEVRRVYRVHIEPVIGRGDLRVGFRPIGAYTPVGIIDMGLG